MYTHPIYHWPPKSRWLQRPSATRKWQPFGTYVHFPFCRNICDFCGYETRLVTEGHPSEFADHAAAQIAAHSKSDDFSSSSRDSIFFGGGTASLMSDRGVAAIFEALAACSRESENSENTLECEPGTISRRRIERMRSHGINRVSVCAQAFDNEQLGRIGRKHTSEDALALIDDCHAEGISNIHVDLMYGLPGQSMPIWEQTLLKTVSLPIKHVSAYKLYVYRHGALHRGNVAKRPDAEIEQITDVLARMHDLAVQILEDAGFRQYTLTDFARPGYESSYIRGCFDGKDLLPIGPSAFGRCGNEVWDISPYVHLYGSGRNSPFDRAFQMSPQEAFKRDVILGLWLLDVSVDDVAKRHGVRPGQDLLGVLETLKDQNAIQFDNGRISIARHQRFWVGGAMARLADLEAGLWGTEVSDPPPMLASKGSSMSLSARQLEQNAIFRMARRDPVLFRSLSDAPLAVIQNLDTGLSEADASELAAVIEGQAGGAGELHELWLAISREHKAAGAER